MKLTVSCLLFVNIFLFCSIICSLISPCSSQDNSDSDSIASNLEYHDDFSKVIFRRKRGLRNKVEELEKRRKDRLMGGKAEVTLKFEMRLWISAETLRRGQDLFGRVDQWRNRYKSKSTTSANEDSDQDHTEEETTTEDVDEETTESENESTEGVTTEEVTTEREDTEDSTDDDNADETTTEVRNKTIVYKDKDLRTLCEDPVFTSVDVNLEGTEVIIFKGDKFYVLENLRYGSGNLVMSGMTRDLFPGFDSDGFTSMMTIKEGHMRGHAVAFYNNQDRAGWMPTGADQRSHKPEFERDSVESLPKNGFTAIMHNREIRTPFVIGFNDETIYYYKTEKKSFTKVQEVNYEDSAEKFPPGITSAFSMPNGFIYLFRNDKYCVRELYYDPEEQGKFCDLWSDTKEFLGCYGTDPPPFSIENYNSLHGIDLNDKRDINDELCEGLDHMKLAKWVDGLNVLALVDENYFTITNFPSKTNVSLKAKVADQLQGFPESPDTVLIVEEGEALRGHIFAFKQGKYRQWSASAKVVAKDVKSAKLRAIIPNSDLTNPMAVGFDDTSVYYYKTDKELQLVKTVEYSESAENWPKGITTGLSINQYNIYLFRGGTYCKRQWKCKDKKHNCCKKWHSAKKLFNC